MSASPTILIIDNDERLVSAISTRLTHCGCTCITAVSGAQGIAAFRDQPVDLVITDINMPAGNGVALLHTLRQTSDVPVIVVTGFRKHFRRDLRAIPNVTVIEKPFDSNELIDLIDADLVLNKRALPRMRAHADPRV